MRDKEQQWKDDILSPALKRWPEREGEFKTASGVPVERLYTPEDIADFDYDRDLGNPGQFPFTRGVQPTMYRGKFWTMRQYAGYGTAEQTNSRFQYLLAQGQTGLSMAFDLPTQMGYDSDHPLAQGEVGKVGVAIGSLRDMETVLADLPLEKISTSMTINSTAAMLLAMYIVVGRRRGIPESKLSGTVQNDILKEYIARGTYIYPVGSSMRLAGDIISYCAESLPHWNPISISGYHIREAGSTATQEIAFTLSNAIAYVEEVQKRGIGVDSFAPRLAFFFNAHSDFLEEIAKYRAARRLWARIMRDRFGATDPQAMMLRFHTQTAGSSLTAQQPQNNVVRVALQALSAVLGGTQSLHTNSLDEALALPTEDSALLALRTQQIIASESGVPSTIDPLAGSYYIESLTDTLETAAEAYIARIDQLGGTLRAIEVEYQQGEIQEAAYRWQKQIDSHERLIVGVNSYEVEEHSHPKILQANPALEAEQIHRLQVLRTERNAEDAYAALGRLRNAAATKVNLMPPIIECVESLCSLGEVSDTLRQVFGSYTG